MKRSITYEKIVIFSVFFTIITVLPVELPNLHGQSVRLDIMAVDDAGKQYNIEVQRASSGALLFQKYLVLALFSIKARYHYFTPRSKSPQLRFFTPKAIYKAFWCEIVLLIRNRIPWDIAG